MIETRTVVHGSPDWHDVVELRRRVLRIPLGLDFTPEQLEEERGQTVLALYEDGQLAACALVVVAGQDAKVRQVAVDPDRQGKGLGRAVMNACEEAAAAAGATRVVLHARETAVPFYLALGYTIEGEPFEEVTLPHRKMTKPL